ncbi:TPA: hypothetical protein G8W61_003632 [Salmonella enterica]|uniref:Uncharacterized protein n=1 Tax=Salmonella enterica TaxID=28901 RepID=A0A760BF49_SALER|nr:hypothetical protein [Salmonella enterica]
MKLSPEAKQAIKTAIEQLRLLLVDDAMDTVREEVSKQLMNDGKCKDEKITISGDCRIEGKLSAGDIEIEGDGNKQVVLEAPELEVSGSNPFEEIQAEIKQLKVQVEQLARQTSCVESELTQQKAISERLSINLLSYGVYRE